MSLMPIDAFVLFFLGISALILATEDGMLDSLTRVPYILIATFAFGYSLWLLSSWEPGPAGFPWQRVAIDISLLTAFGTRALGVLAQLRRNTGHLFSVRPFGHPTKRQE